MDNSFQGLGDCTASHFCAAGARLGRQSSRLGLRQNVVIYRDPAMAFQRRGGDVVAEVESSQKISPQVHKHPGFPTKLPVPLHVGLPIHNVGPVSFAAVRRLCTGPGAPLLCAWGAGYPEAIVWLCKGVVGCAIE